MLFKIKRNFFDLSFDKGIASIFLLKELCSINIKTRYIKTIPVEVARPANDEATEPAICCKFGIKFMSKPIPIFFEIYSEKVNNFCCNIGVALYNSTNIGRICVANKTITMPTLANDKIIDKIL